MTKPPGVDPQAIENYLLTRSLSEIIQAGEEGIAAMPRIIKGAIHRRAWESIYCTPTKTMIKFDSVTDWIRAKPPEGLDTTEEVIEVLIKSSQDAEALDNFQQLVRRAKPAIGSHGGDRRSDNAPKLDHSGKGGTGVDYLTARLKRDHPELLDEIGKGKRFPSVRAAAMAAGIVKPVLQLSLTTPEKLVTDLQKRLPEDFWAQFVAALAAVAGLVKPGAKQDDRRVVPARAAKAKPQADQDGTIKDVPISFLAEYANGVRSAKSVLATFYGSTNIDFYAKNLWTAVDKSLQIFIEADPKEQWGRIQWGDHPWQAVEVKDKWEFLDRYIKPIVEQGRLIVCRYDAIMRAANTRSAGPASQAKTRTVVSKAFAEDSEVPRSELPKRLKTMQEYLLDAVENDCRLLASRLADWRDTGIYQEFAPTWEEFVSEHIKQPIEWVNHMIDAVKILDAHKLDR